MTHPVSRRRFLAAAPVALAAPAFVRAADADGKPRVAFVGCGNQGMGLLTRVLRWDLARVVAVCDVNRGSHGYREPDHFYGREPAKKLVDEAYKSADCKAAVDFRDVLAMKDVDAVFLVVPDH
jgi:predicted dehydrogenase